MTTKLKGKKRLRCLTCHRHLPPSTQRLSDCSACGSANHAVDRERYWSRNPKLVQLSERITWVSVTILFLAVPAGSFLAFAGHEWVGIAFPLVLVFAGLTAFSSSRLLKNVQVPTPVFWLVAFAIIGYMLLDQAETMRRHGYGLAFELGCGALALAAMTALLALWRGPAWREARLAREMDLVELQEQLDGRMRNLEAARSYCLACFATMPSSTGVCDHCGFTNFSADRREYWNQNPRIRSLETLAKFLAVSLGALLAITCIVALPNAGMRSGWFVAMSFAFSYALCMTVAKLRRHMPSFQPSLVWSLFVALLGVTLFPFYLFREQGLFAQGLATIVCFALAGVPLLLGQLFERWKRRLREGEVPNGAPLEAR